MISQRLTKKSDGSWTFVAALLAAMVCLTLPASPAAADKPRLLAERFVDRLAAEDFEAAYQTFDPTMRQALPQAKLEAVWQQVVGQIGAFQSRLGSRVQKVGPYDVVLVTCAFERVRLDIKVVLNGEGQVAGLFFQPSQAEAAAEQPPYIDPKTFEEKEGTVGSGKWALPATLSLPKSPGPHPGLVLVHGSGPNDRDGAIGPNKPFRDLAWGLASQGVAVLRYEKRTQQYPEEMKKMQAAITVEQETIEDALLAVRLLAATPGVDPGKIFVLGHSLGAMLIPRIGAQGKNIRGLIVMAGPTRPLEDIILAQHEYLFSLDGGLDAAEKKELAHLKQQVDMVKSPALSKDTPLKELPFGVPGAYWLDLRGYRPAEAARKLSVPLLVLQGGRDYQTTRADFDIWKKALAGQPDVTFKLYPSLNHLFMPGQGKSAPAEYQVAGHVSGDVIRDIAAWIEEHSE